MKKKILIFIILAVISITAMVFASPIFAAYTNVQPVPTPGYSGIIGVYNTDVGALGEDLVRMDFYAFGSTRGTSFNVALAFDDSKVIPVTPDGDEIWVDQDASGKNVYYDLSDMIRGLPNGPYHHTLTYQITSNFGGTTNSWAYFESGTAPISHPKEETGSNEIKVVFNYQVKTTNNTVLNNFGDMAPQDNSTTPPTPAVIGLLPGMYTRGGTVVPDAPLALFSAFFKPADGLDISDISGADIYVYGTAAVFFGGSIINKSTDAQNMQLQRMPEINGSHTITTSIVEGEDGYILGMISPYGTKSVLNGGSQGITITSQDFYVIDTILVDGAPVTAASGKFGYYLSFDNVYVDHTVEVSFKNSNPSATYTVTAEVVGSNGVFTEPIQTVASGSINTQVTAIAMPGYYIKYFYVNGSDYNNGRIRAAEGQTSYTYTIPNVIYNTHVQVVFSKPGVEITTSVTPTAGGTITPGDTISVGADFPYTVTPNEGWDIQSITVNGSTVSLTSDEMLDGYSGTLTSVTADTSIAAILIREVKTVTTTVSTASGTITPTPTTPVGYGDPFTYTATPAVGYEIERIDIINTDTGIVITSNTAIAGQTTEYQGLLTSVTVNTTVSVHFRRIELTVTIATSPSGSTYGTAVAQNGLYTVLYGNGFTYTVTPNNGNGYVIDSIVVTNTATGTEIETIPASNATIATQLTQDNITVNTTITVNFVLAKYNVILNTNPATGTGTITPLNIPNVIHGSVISYTATPATGYVFDRIEIRNTNTNALIQTITSIADTTAPYGGSENITQNTTITAYYRNENPIITTMVHASSPSGSGSISPLGNTTVTYNGSFSYTVSATLGNKIASITIDGVTQTIPVGSTTFTDSLTNITANHTIVVTFEIITLTVTSSVSGVGGVITPLGTQTYNYNSTPMYTVTANAYYVIDKIEVDGITVTGTGNTTSQTYTFPALTTNRQIIAYFKLKGYSVSSTPAANGTISPNDSETVNAFADSREYTITADIGYEIDFIKVNGVTVTGAGTPLSQTIQMTNITEDKVITFAFKVRTFTITATVTGTGGTISPVGTTTYNYGSNAVYSVTITPGYMVDNITVDGVVVPLNSSNQYTFNSINANHTINISFTQLVLRVTTVLNPTVGGTISAGENPIAYNSTYTLTVSAKTGYGFNRIDIYDANNVKIDTIVGAYIKANLNASGEFTRNFVITESIIIIAYFDNLYSITTSITPIIAGASITPSETNIVAGSDKTIQVVIPEGYAVDTFTVNGFINSSYSGSTNTTILYQITNIHQNYNIIVKLSKNIKYYTLKGTMWFDAGGIFNEIHGGSFGTVDLYSGIKTTAESTRTADGHVDLDGLEFIERYTIPTSAYTQWEDTNLNVFFNGGEFVFEGLMEGQPYVLVLHKRNNTSIVIYNVNYTPVSSDCVVDVGEYFVYAGDYDTVINGDINGNYSSWESTYGDGIINAFDQTVFIAAKNTYITAYYGMSYNPYDLDDTGLVNAYDLSLFMSNYGLNYGRDAAGLANGVKDFNSVVTVIVP